MLRIALVGNRNCLGQFLTKLNLENGQTITGYLYLDGTPDASSHDINVMNQFQNFDDLTEKNDLLVFVDKGEAQAELVARALRQCKHVLLKNPPLGQLSEAKELVNLAEEAGVKIRIANPSRYNLALTSASTLIESPRYIELQHHGVFNNSAMLAPVVFEHLLSDIDLVLSMVKSRVKKIASSGVPIINGSPDIVNANLEFENGCTANLVISRVAIEQHHEVKVFQRDNYLKINILHNELEIVGFDKPAPSHPGLTSTETFSEFDYHGRNISSSKLKFVNVEVESLEFQDFAASINNPHKYSKVNHDGFYALDIAHQIMNKLNY